MEISNKVGRYFLIGIGIFIIGIFFYGQLISKPNIEKYGIWVIATPYDTRGGGKGGSTYIKFKYKYLDKEYESRENGFYGKIREMLKNRYLIKISSKDPNLCYFTDDYIVPDSIKEAPPEGWEKLPEWASDKIRWFNTK